MGEQEQDPLDQLKGLAEKYSSVKLGPGIVGKTAIVLLGLLGLWAIIFWRLDPKATSSFFNVALVIGGLAITGVGVWWIRKAYTFAEKHPGVALLGGAQLIEYQKWEAQVKGFPPLDSPLIPDPHVPSLPRDIDSSHE